MALVKIGNDKGKIQQRYSILREYIRKELARKKEVTLRLLWLEYRQANLDGHQYNQGCLLYHPWTGKLGVCLRQTHRVGEKIFVDYAGQMIPVTDTVSGKSWGGRLPPQTHPNLIFF